MIIIDIYKPYSYLNRWSQIPYPGQDRVYHGLDTNAGSWPLNYIKRVEENVFTTLDGEPIAWEIKNPCNVNFQQELKEVYEASENLTRYQKKQAIYWGTGVPLQQIGPIALELFAAYGVTPAKSARIMNCLANVLNDAFVITWYFKYLWDYPRPVQLDQTFETVIPTPIFPTYPSGHSVVSSAAMEVLAYYFPTEAQKLQDLALEASNSRLYGGVHFKSDLDEGVRLGKQIGKIAIEYIKTHYDEDGIAVDVIYNEDKDANIMPKYYRDDDCDWEC